MYTAVIIQSEEEKQKLKTGVILDIIAVDGARRLFPLFFAHAAGEAEHWWLWALREFRLVYGETPLLNGAQPLAFISDLGASFRAAARAVFPGVPLFSCTMHREVRFIVYCAKF